LPEEIRNSVSGKLEVVVGPTGDYASINEAISALRYYKDEVDILVDAENHTEDSVVLISHGDFSNMTIRPLTTGFSNAVVDVNETALMQYYQSFPDVDEIIAASDYICRPYMIVNNAIAPRILVNFTSVPDPSSVDSRFTGLFAYNGHVNIGYLASNSGNAGFSNFPKNNTLIAAGSTLTLLDAVYMRNAGSGLDSGLADVSDNGGVGANVAVLAGSTFKAGLSRGGGAVTMESSLSDEIVCYDASTVIVGVNAFITASVGKNTVNAFRGSLVQRGAQIGTATIDSSSALFTSSSLGGVTNAGFGSGAV